MFRSDFFFFLLTPDHSFSRTTYHPQYPLPSLFRTLLRYIHSVKAQATAQIEAARLTSDFNEDIADTLASNGGVIQLAESGIGDEEVHALAALLRGNQNITELNLRANVVTDEGARALGAVLAGTSALRTIDLRENSVGKAGVQGQGRQRVPALSLPARGRCQAQCVGAPLGRPGAWRRVRLVRGEGRGVSD